ncbi:hypothetical protein QNO09_05720 [Streptomyces sp. 378]|uniref:hypothetical protein n=1 Tax=Streptomyces sp. 378 TaxID=3049412 RepID=UPI0024C33A48|nr:hypothetical protein [Streptomyces sp. 378]MDK1342804.1 hypothetical protein [Streptomyces sp. 378]
MTADDPGGPLRIGALVPLTRPGWVQAGQHLLAGLESAVNAFTIAGTPASGTDPLLIVSADATDLDKGRTVRVTGTVTERFEAVRVKDDLGVNWNDDLFTEWDDKHYIVASTVTPSTVTPQ